MPYSSFSALYTIACRLFFSRPLTVVPFRILLSFYLPSFVILHLLPLLLPPSLCCATLYDKSLQVYSAVETVICIPVRDYTRTGPGGFVTSVVHTHTHTHTHRQTHRYIQTHTHTHSATIDSAMCRVNICKLTYRAPWFQAIYLPCLFPLPPPPSPPLLPSNTISIIANTISFHLPY